LESDKEVMMEIKQLDDYEIKGDGLNSYWESIIDMLDDI